MADKSDVGNTEDDSNVLAKQIKDGLGNPQELWKYIGETDGVGDTIQPIAWELTGSIMSYLKDNGVSENLEIYGKCLEKIAEFALPKDLYLGILEQFDPSAESIHVKLLLPSLYIVLVKICEEDLEACIIVLETTFSTLSYFIESLNIPNYENFDPYEKRQKTFEEKKIEYFIEKYLTIVKPAIKKIFSNNTKESQNIIKCRGYTFQFFCNLLVMLGQLDLDDLLLPIGVGDQDKNTSQKTSDKEKFPDKVTTDNDQYTCDGDAMQVCYDVMQMITDFYSPDILWKTVNWFTLYPPEERSENSKFEMEEQVDRGRACFLFLLLSRGVLYENFPKIYANQSLLVYTATSLNTLLSCKNQSVVWKGLELLCFILNRINESSVSRQETLHNISRVGSNSHGTMFSQELIFTIFKHLIDVAVLLPSKTIRAKAIQCVPLLLDRFLWKDKFILLVHLLKTTEHAGVSGILIGFLKDKLSAILRDTPPKDSESFCEPHKMSVLGEIVFTLPQGSETDLLQDCDRLMPALNLLRFILIRDKSNRTGIYDHIDKIDKIFLKPLRVAIDLSRAHYKNELMNHKKNVKKPLGEQTEFVVNGTPLPALGREEQKQTLEAALHSFDMIEIVAVRVIELVDAR